jgi:hypothetical protein
VSTPQIQRVAAALTVAFLAGCAGASSTPPTVTSFAKSTSQTASRITKAGKSCPCLYVTQLSSNTVSVYPIGAKKNAKPIQNISGSSTGISGPWDVAVDGSGNMYVANQANSITIYAAGATGNVAPVGTISGSNTGLSDPEGVAIDPVNGDIYVANTAGGSSEYGTITVYAPGNYGNVAPIATIAGYSTGLSSPEGLVLDASGNIYVPNGNATITVYAAGSNGDVAPTATIGGSYTKLSSPYQVALDSSNNIYVANYQGSTGINVLEFAAGSNGNLAPIKTIAGTKTKLDGTDGIALDGSGNEYGANYTSNSITVYKAGSNGNRKPIRFIEGSKTELDGPEGITIH